MGQGKTQRFEQLVQPNLNARQIVCDEGLQIHRPEQVHDQVAVFFGDHNLLHLDDVGVIQRFPDFGFVLEDSFLLGIAQSFGEQQFHGVTVWCALLHHFAHLTELARCDEIDDLIPIDFQFIVSHLLSPISNAISFRLSDPIQPILAHKRVAPTDRQDTQIRGAGRQQSLNLTDDCTSLSTGATGPACGR